MKKLGKKRSKHEETVQAYACSCAVCPCPSCMNAVVLSFLSSGERATSGGTLTYF